VTLGANIEGRTIARTSQVASFCLGETSGRTTRLRRELQGYGAAGEWTRIDTNVGGEGKNHGLRGCHGLEAVESAACSRFIGVLSE
jgi:hypothetical protein